MSNRSASADIGVYLETLDTVITGDLDKQAETLREVSEAADVAPTTTNRLMYALALAMPGHPGSDPALGRERLSRLLDADDGLLPAERMLARVQLQSAEQQLVLIAVEQSLRERLAAAERANDVATQQQIANLIAENERLQLALEDATAKLDALTSIEQSIQEIE